MKAAPGVGIVSSFVMESDDLDEIDLVCFHWKCKFKQSLTTLVTGMARRRSDSGRDKLFRQGKYHDL